MEQITRVDCVYYDLWGRDCFTPIFTKAKQYFELGLGIDKEYYQFINTRENNRAFIAEIEEYVLNGSESLDYWLRGLVADYVKRCSKIDNDSEYNLDYYVDWLNNTRFLATHYGVVQWCNDYEILVKSIPYNTEQFESTITRVIGKENTIYLLDIMHTMTPKDVAFYYRKFNLKQRGVELMDFYNLIENIVHRKGERGWNYNNIKNF